jgi:hypothetical protein
MKILLIVFLLFFGYFQLNAQSFKTIELKPIGKHGGTYFYNIKRVHGGEIIAKHHLRKGIERYNSLVIGASSQSVGIGLTYRF